jgi:hypothetical protein
MSRAKETYRRIQAEIAQERAAALLGLRHHPSVDRTYPEPPRRS